MTIPSIRTIGIDAADIPRVSLAKRLTDADEVADAFEAGLVVSGAPMGVPNASLGGLRAIGAISNCPITFNLGPA